MVENIRTKEEYDKIMSVLLEVPFESDLTKHQIYRLRKKAEHFVVLDSCLYLRVKDGLHKKVLYAAQIDVMKLEVEKLHPKKTFWA